MSFVFKGLNTENVVIDKENMCIDRSTEFGQYIDSIMDEVRKNPDPNYVAMVSQLVSYMEACFIIKDRYPGEEGDEKIKQLTHKLVSV